MIMGIKKTLKRMSGRPETRTLLELYVGIILSSIVMLGVGIIFARPMWMYAVGIALGTGATMFQLYNMFDTIDRALSAGEGKSQSYMTIKSTLRLLVSGGVLIGAYFIGLTAFVGAVLGLFSLKISALLNPFVKKRLPDFQ